MPSACSLATAQISLRPASCASNWNHYARLDCIIRDGGCSEGARLDSGSTDCLVSAKDGLQRLSTIDGSIRWSVEVAEGVGEGLAVSANGDTAVMSTRDNGIAAFELATGSRGASWRAHRNHNRCGVVG